MSKFEKNIRLLTPILTFLLVLVGLWYAWETRGLKIQTTEQLTEMREQFQLANVPILFPSIINREQVKESIMEGKTVQTTGKIRYSKEEMSEVLKFYLLLDNFADTVAYDVRAYIFDSDTKSYLKAAKGFAYIKPKDIEFLSFFKEKTNYMNEEQLLTELNIRYDLNLDLLNDYILKKNNAVLLFFNDVQGNTYLRTREFLYDEQNNRLQGRVVLHDIKQKVQ